MGTQAVRLDHDLVQQAITEQKILEIPCGLIKANPNQPRRYFDPARLLQLKRSIEAVGQHTEATVKPLKKHPQFQFQLVVGERRWRVCTELGRPLKAKVKVYRDQDMELLESILENCNRDEFKPMETAWSLDKMRGTELVKRLAKKGDQLRIMSEMFGEGRGPAWVDDYLRLLQLPPELQVLLGPPTPQDDRLPVTLAFRLATLPPDHAVEIHKIKTDQHLSTKQTQRLIDQRIQESGLSDKRRGRKLEDFRNFERALRLAHKQAENLLEQAQTDPPRFEKMFRTKNTAEIRGLVGQVDEIAALWERVGKAVKNVRILKD